MFIEEGRYKDIETFNIPTSPKSIRLVKDDMGSPELYLASSTNYEGMKSGFHLGVIRGLSGAHCLDLVLNGLLTRRNL